MISIKQGSKRILLVDHEIHILHVLALKLRENGYDVIACQSALEGLEMGQAARPDLVIAEFQLPHLSGLELCQRLHQRYADMPLPSLILSAQGVWIDETVLHTAGVNRCIQKPFSPREVVGMVEDILLGVAV